MRRPRRTPRVNPKRGTRKRRNINTKRKPRHSPVCIGGRFPYADGSRTFTDSVENPNLLKDVLGIFGVINAEATSQGVVVTCKFHDDNDKNYFLENDIMSDISERVAKHYPDYKMRAMYRGPDQNTILFYSSSPINK